MFQKHFTVDAENKVSGKDRKKLKATLHRLYPRFTEDRLELVFPLKSGECTVARIKAPHRGHLYLFNGLPFALELSKNDGVIPCLPVLWQIPQLLPMIVLKHFTVSKFILGGADLMLPGAKMPLQEGFLRGTLVSLSVPGNPYPFAIGRATMSSIEASEGASGKGKLVEIVHYYGDLMTVHYGEMHPPNPGFTASIIYPEQPIEDTEGKEDEDVPSDDPDTEESSEETTAELSPERQQAEMDDLLRRCFLQALHKSVKDVDLPLAAGELWIKHMLPNKSAPHALFWTFADNRCFQATRCSH